MNQKDYKAVAEIIWNKLLGNDLPDTAKEVAEALADYFEKERDNPISLKKVNELYNRYGEFKREQFMKDCGVE